MLIVEKQDKNKICIDVLFESYFPRLQTFAAWRISPRRLQVRHAAGWLNSLPRSFPAPQRKES
jgi:hypothetical protein